MCLYQCYKYGAAKNPSKLRKVKFIWKFWNKCERFESIKYPILYFFPKHNIEQFSWADLAHDVVDQEGGGGGGGGGGPGHCQDQKSSELFPRLALQVANHHLNILRLHTFQYCPLRNISRLPANQIKLGNISQEVSVCFIKDAQHNIITQQDLNNYTNLSC